MKIQPILYWNHPSSPLAFVFPAFWSSLLLIHQLFSHLWTFWSCHMLWSTGRRRLSKRRCRSLGLFGSRMNLLELSLWLGQSLHQGIGILWRALRWNSQLILSHIYRWCLDLPQSNLASLVAQELWSFLQISQLYTDLKIWKLAAFKIKRYQIHQSWA